MGMLPVRIDERHVVRVKDPASSPDGVHYWLHLVEGGDDDGLNGTSVATAECVLSWDLLKIDDEDYDPEPLERSMAHGFAAGVSAEQAIRSAREERRERKTI